MTTTSVPEATPIGVQNKLSVGLQQTLLRRAERGKNIMLRMITTSFTVVGNFFFCFFFILFILKIVKSKSIVSLLNKLWYQIKYIHSFYLFIYLYQLCTFSFALLSSKSSIYALTNLSIYYLVDNVYVECTCTLLSTYLSNYLFTTSTYLL